MGFLQNNYNISTPSTTTIVEAKFTHSCAIGQTGCGKTTGYIYPNLDERIKKGHSILLYDYKGKEQAALKALALKYNRLDDVIEIGIPWGAKVNLIQFMSESEIYDFVLQLTGLNEKDKYWSISAANISVAIYKIIRAYLSVLEKANSFNFYDNLKEYLNKKKLPLQLIFSSINSVVATVNSIALFYNDIRSVRELFVEVINAAILQDIEYNTDTEIQDKYEEIISALINLENVVDNDIDILKPFDENKKKSNSSNTLQTIVLAMSTTFATIATLKEFNSNELNLLKALNSAKIVVINCRLLSNNVLSCFTGSLLQELSKRSNQRNCTPLSIFIDEAQRVMNKDMDVHIDVLRESKVELFLAFQNHNLMVEALGENNFLALYKNLSKIFHFKNVFNFDEIETEDLDTYEYRCKSESKKCTASYIYLSAKELFHAQLTFQKRKSIHKKLGISDKSKILIYDTHLYLDKKLVLEDIDGNTSIVSIQDNQRAKDITNYLSELKNREMEYEELSQQLKEKLSEINSALS